MDVEAERAGDNSDAPNAGDGEKVDFGFLPKSLISTVVLPSYFRRGVGELQLPVDTDALWQQAWLVASNGI